MENNLGFKELYDVTLKATYNIEMGNRTIQSGEVVAIFDRVQLAQFNEIKTYITANGGYNNGTKIIWNDTKEMKLSFTKGTFSQNQMALLSNAKLVSGEESSNLLIHQREKISFGLEETEFELKYVPQQNIFVYNQHTGDKVSSSRYFIDKKVFKMSADEQAKEESSEFIIDYEYQYIPMNYQMLKIGSNLTNGYLSFTAKTRIKDDVTGQVTTGIINIPKLKLMSDLSMTLGDSAAPQIGKFDAVAIPVGPKGNQVVMEFIMLGEDIDSDM